MIKPRHSSLLRDSSGAAAVEFAMIAPMLITMVLGVMQLGLAMYSYNSLRGAANDIARYAVIQTQQGTFQNDADLTTQARAIAVAMPYALTTSRLTISVTQPTGQRVSGATEKTIAVSYNVPSVLGMIGMGDIPISYSRPVFLEE